VTDGFLRFSAAMTSDPFSGLIDALACPNGVSVSGAWLLALSQRYRWRSEVELQAVSWKRCLNRSILKTIIYKYVGGPISGAIFRTWIVPFKIQIITTIPMSMARRCSVLKYERNILYRMTKFMSGKPVLNGPSGAAVN
jgi:hypothetical protein